MESSPSSEPKPDSHKVYDPEIEALFERYLRDAKERHQSTLEDESITGDSLAVLMKVEGEEIARLEERIALERARPGGPNEEQQPPLAA